MALPARLSWLGERACGLWTIGCRVKQAQRPTESEIKAFAIEELAVVLPHAEEFCAR
jgi:hypothetical protein